MRIIVLLPPPACCSPSAQLFLSASCSSAGPQVYPSKQHTLSISPFVCPQILLRRPARGGSCKPPNRVCCAGGQGYELLFYGASIFENWRGTAVGVTWRNSQGIVEAYNSTFPNRYHADVLAISGTLLLCFAYNPLFRL